MSGYIESNQSGTKILCLRTGLGPDKQPKYFMPTIQRTSILKIVNYVVKDYTEIEDAISEFTEMKNNR